MVLQQQPTWATPSPISNSINTNTPNLNFSQSTQNQITDSGPLNINMNMIQQQDNLAIDADKLRSDFLEVLRSRRPPNVRVPLTVQPGKHVLEPLYQEIPTPAYIEAIESTPKANIVNIPDFRELLREENLYLITEVGEQGRVPVLILSMKETNDKKRPAIVILHGTMMNKESLRPMLEAFASRGYIVIAIDSRHHGERGSGHTAYVDALISAWKTGDTMPFIYDTVWDLIKLADYLLERDDIDQSRIGITGVSLGGMHAWFAAFVDTRYSVVAPIIAVQGFRWAIDHEEWHARVESLDPLFEEARIDLGRSAVDKEVVEKVWEKIAPGLASHFDAPFTVPATAPRPLLMLNGEEDPRCPVPGLEVPMSRARKAYEKAHSPDDVKLVIEPGIGHEPTPFMVKEASDWFDKYFKL